jgi:hypothetical protein
MLNSFNAEVLLSCMRHEEHAKVEDRRSSTFTRAKRTKEVKG